MFKLLFGLLFIGLALSCDVLFQKTMYQDYGWYEIIIGQITNECTCLGGSNIQVEIQMNGQWYPYSVVGNSLQIGASSLNFPLNTRVRINGILLSTTGTLDNISGQQVIGSDYCGPPTTSSPTAPTFQPTTAEPTQKPTKK